MLCEKTGTRISPLVISKQRNTPTGAWYVVSGKPRIAVSIVAEGDVAVRGHSTMSPFDVFAL